MRVAFRVMRDVLRSMSCAGTDFEYIEIARDVGRNYRGQLGVRGLALPLSVCSPAGQYGWGLRSKIRG